MINPNIRVAHALELLNIKEWSLHREPTTEAEFLQSFYKHTGVDENGHAIVSNDPLDFGVTWSQIIEAMQTASDLYENNLYKAARAKEYPPLEDLADAMYWSSQGDNTKLEAYYAACEAVKQKYPKVS